MVGVAVIFEDDGAAREPVGAFGVLCDEPEPGVGSGELGRRSWTPVEGLSTGMSVASTGGLVGADGLVGAGGGMEGRMGFGLWTGGVSCCA